MLNNTLENYREVLFVKKLPGYSWRIVAKLHGIIVYAILIVGKIIA
jgi:hypothetical protein